MFRGRQSPSLELVEWANRIFSEATIQDVLVILNRVRDAEMESYLKRKLAEKGLEPLGIIRHDPAIARSWLEGTRLEGMKTKEDVEMIVKKLEAVAARNSIAV